MKLAAIIDRGTRKDMVDLYYILQKVPLEKLFQVTSVKYAQVRTFAISAARALAYFDDTEDFSMPRMLDKTPWSKTISGSGCNGSRPKAHSRFMGVGRSPT